MTKRDILSDADVEALFETNSISDIKQFNIDLEKDVDKKREELRTTVGERYRDLMEAAETITHMKTTSIDVVNAFKDIAATTYKYEYYSSISSIKYQQNVQVNEENVNAGENYDSSDLATTAQIKLLMDSPEIMWSSVDNGDYLTAAQVYLFARHIHTNLTFNSNSVGGKRTSTIFPIIERQWSSIVPFYETILNGCTQIMSNEVNSKESDKENIEISNIVRSMAAMTLLKGIKTKDLFNEFLSLREKTIQNVIFSEEIGAKSHIRNTILSTMFCVQSCSAFLPSQDNAETLERVLQEISEKPAISFFQNISLSPVMKYLPNIIRDFCPSIVVNKDRDSSRCSKPDDLDQEFLTTECTNWLDRVHDMISNGTSKVLAHVNTLSGLSMIRRSTYDYLALTCSKNKHSTFKDWNSVCVNVLNRTVNIWDEFYRNLFRERAEELISREIQNAISYLGSSLTSISDLKNMDIADFVWVEGNTNESILDHDKTKSDKGRILSSLELKARSYPPTVQTICQKFDELLQSLLSQLSEYVTVEKSSDKDEPNKISNILDIGSVVEKSKIHEKEDEPFRLDQDNNAILDFVENSTSISLTKMLNDVNLFVKNEQIQLTVDESRINQRYVVMARICQAVPELSPSLENCCTASEYFRQENLRDFYENNDYLGELKNLSIKSSKVSDERHQKLKHVNESLIKTCSFLLTSWIEMIGTIMINQLKANLTNTVKDNLNMLPQWEAVEISEEGEDNNQIKSTIRIPGQISVGLFQVIHQYAHSIYSVGSHNLPIKGINSKTLRSDIKYPLTEIFIFYFIKISIFLCA